MRILCLCLIFITSTAMAQSRCENIFIGETLPSVELSIHRLAEMKLKLELSKTQGNSSVTQTALEYNYKMKEIELIRYLSDHGFMSTPDFYSAIKIKISEIQNKSEKIKKENRRRLEKEYVIKIPDAPDFVNKATFYKISPGSFEMKYQGFTQIRSSYEMMATPITQWMWARLAVLTGEKDHALLKPSFFSDGLDSLPLDIYGVEIQMKPHHPVESLSYFDIHKLLASLNQMSREGSRKDQDLLRQVIAGHQKGDEYSLPTNAQWEFAMNQTGEGRTQIFKYAWHMGNSSKQTQPVVRREPRWIEGQAFYDLEGNIEELTHDVNGGLVWARGGSFKEATHKLGSHFMKSYGLDDKSESLGFRLVRIHGK